MPKVTSKAKSTSKPATKTAKKAAPKAPQVKVSPEELIEKACSDALQKLQALQLDTQLQADLEWCLGSFRNDRNPYGLFQMAERALEVFKAEASKKTKGVTAKLIKDIEKAIASRA
ncbi:MAG: hypothetical protein AB7E82_15105 [Cyclobacteriaceae bacterium]